MSQRSPSIEAMDHHHHYHQNHDIKSIKNFVIIFDFHHSCIQTFDIKTHTTTQDFISLKHAREGGAHKTFIEEWYSSGFELENYPPIKHGRGPIDDIPEKRIKEEIYEFFKLSTKFIPSNRNDDIRDLIIVCEFKYFPLKQYFNQIIKKFEIFSNVGLLKFMTQTSTAYLPYFYDAKQQQQQFDCDEPTDLLRRNKFCLIFRQTNKRIDAVLFKNIKNRLKIINNIHRVIDNTGLNELEIAEILETIRTVKNKIEDCDYYIFELKKRGIEHIFSELIDSENPTIFLNYDESRFDLNKKFYERMGLNLDTYAEREEDFLKLSQSGKYAAPTMQGSNIANHHLSNEQKLESECKFPLRRPPALPGRMENTDPYGETSISPLQWNRFLRTAKHLPENKIPARVKFQRHMFDGPVANAPPLDVVEAMCEDAIEKEEEDKEKYMNFDDEWLEKNMNELKNLEIFDFEAAIDPMIDDPIEDSDDEYISGSGEEEDEDEEADSEEEAIQELAKICENRNGSSSKSGFRSVCKIGNHSLNLKISHAQIQEPGPSRIKVETPTECINSIQNSLKALFSITQKSRSKLSPQKQLSPNPEDEPPEEDEMPVIIPSPKKQIKLMPKEEEKSESYYLFSEPSSSKPPTIQQISQYNSIDSDEEDSMSGSSPMGFLYNRDGEQPPVLERQVPMEIDEEGDCESSSTEESGGSPTPLASPAPINLMSERTSVAEVAPIEKEKSPEELESISKTSNVSKSTVPSTKNPKTPKLAVAAVDALNYPLPDFDYEPHLRQIFPFSYKLYNEEWNFEKTPTFKDLGYAEKEVEPIFYTTPQIPDGPLPEQLKHLEEAFPEKFGTPENNKNKTPKKAKNAGEEDGNETPIIIERMRLKTIDISPDDELLLNPDWCNPLKGRTKKLKEKQHRRKNNKKKRILNDDEEEGVILE